MPPREPVLAYVALGANLGDATAAIRQALVALDKTVPLTSCVVASSLYPQVPVDAQGPAFINAVAAVSTGLPAPLLLAELQRLELRAGRQRPYRHAPRTLDLDLLLYGGGRIDSPALTLPHPRMFERAFVLQPLAEIAPQLVDAALLASVAGQAIERIGS